MCLPLRERLQRRRHGRLCRWATAATAGICGTVYQVSVHHPQYGAVEGRPVTVFPRIETVLAVSLGSA